MYFRAQHFLFTSSGGAEQTNRALCEQRGPKSGPQRPNPAHARAHEGGLVGRETDDIDSRAIQTTQKCGGETDLLH